MTACIPTMSNELTFATSSTSMLRICKFDHSPTFSTQGTMPLLITARFCRGIRLITARPFALFTMMLPVLAYFLYLLPSSAGALPSTLTVVPLPIWSTTGTNVVCLAFDFHILIDTAGKSMGEIPEDLQNAAERTEKALWRTQHQYLSVQRGIEFFEGSSTGNGCQHYLSELVLVVEADGDDIPSIFRETIRPVEVRTRTEAYSLSLPLGAAAQIRSQTALGILRGLTTFEQLFYRLPSKTASDPPQRPAGESTGTSGGAATEQCQPGPEASAMTVGQSDVPYSPKEVKGAIFAPFGPYEIRDKPAFGWRAVLLDTSRHYFGVKAILKVCSVFRTFGLLTIFRPLTPCRWSR
jgi:hexosaminidase